MKAVHLPSNISFRAVRPQVAQTRQWKSWLRQNRK